MSSSRTAKNPRSATKRSAAAMSWSRRSDFALFLLVAAC
jgi:hypothetical protein